MHRVLTSGWCSHLCRVLAVLMTFGQILPAASAAEFRVFRKTYVRTSNTLPLEFDVVRVLNPQTAWRLHAVNGNPQDPTVKRMTSANLLVNLSLLLTGNNFNKNVAVVDRPVQLRSSNLVTNQYNGPLGAQMMVELIGADNQPPAAAWQLPTADLATNAATISARLALSDDVAGLDPATVQILLDGASVRPQFTALAAPALIATLDATLALAEGHHLLEATVKDIAGQPGSASVAFTVDRTPPTIHDLLPADATTVATPRPAISANFSDSLSGVDPALVKMAIDGLDVTAQASISGTGVALTPAADLADGLHAIRVDAADHAGNAKHAEWSVRILTIVTPPVTPASGFIHGLVLHAETEQPIPDAVVTAHGLTGEVRTDSDGRFQYPTPDAGEFLLDISAAGFTPVQRKVQVLATRDVDVESAFLTPLDPKVTLITPEQGGLATDSTGDFQVEFPPGVAPRDLDVRVTHLPTARQLPGPLPNGQAFIDGVFFEPRFTAFNGTATYRHLNHRNLPPGTAITLLLWNEFEYRWKEAGTGHVTADGRFMELPIIRFFCWYACVRPWTPPPGAERPDREEVKTPTSDVKDTCKSWNQEVSSSICPESGDLSINHTLPALRTLGQPRAPTFTYRSTTANPSALIGTDYLLETASKPGDAGTVVPVTTSADIHVEGRRLQVSFTGTAGQTHQAFLWDGRNARGELVPTGAYPYTLSLSNDYPTTFHGTAIPTDGLTPLATSVTGRAIIQNRRDSSFGAGWSLNGLQQLFPQPDGTVLVADGEGSATVFRADPMADVVIVNYTSNDVSILFGHGDGSFQPQQTITMVSPTVPSPLPIWPAAADLNQDGFQDLAIALNRNGQIALLFNRGGIFDPPQLLAVGAAPGFLMARDLDLDGRPDLVTVNQGSSDISILLGNGDGTFQSELRLAVGASPNSVAAGDLNGDGQIDLVAANGGISDGYGTRDDSLSLLLANADGTFQPEQRFGSGLRPRSVTIEDFNRDGRLDVAVVADNRGQVAVLLGHGDGTFQLAQQFPAGDTFLALLAPGDFNEDGVMDLAVTNPNASTISVLLGVGDGSFQAPTAFGMASASLGLVVADLNRDGHRDLAASSGTKVLSVLLGNGDGTFQRFQQYPVGSDPAGIVAADFNGRTGDPDQVFTGLPGDFSVLRHHPDGAWARRLTDGTEVHFDARGLHTDTTDRNGNVSRYTYSALTVPGCPPDCQGQAQNRLTRMEYPGAAAFDMAYDAGGTLASITDSTGRTTHFSVDASGDLRSLANPDGTSRGFSYDAEHRMRAQVNERGFTTDYVYDSVGRLAQAILPERPVFSPADGAMSPQREVRRFTPAEVQGLINALPAGVGTPANPAAPIPTPLSSFQDGLGHTTQLITDAYGAPLKIIDALGRTTLIERDVNGLPVKITRPNGAARFFIYDTRGNLTSTKEDISLPGIPFLHRAIYQFEYDPLFNQITKRTDARRDTTFDPVQACPQGCTTRIEHDAQGNPLRIIDHLGNVTAFAYDSRGLLVTATDALGTATPAVPDDHQTRFAHEPATGNLLTTTDPLGRISQLAYDAAGNVVRSTDPQLRDTAFTYDAMNRLQNVRDANLGLTAYAYDPTGNLVRVDDANLHATLFAYDALNQLTRVENPRGEAREYAYDLNRNLARVTDAKGQQTLFQYDAANQVTAKVLNDALGVVQDTVTYGYDLLGNLALAQDADSRLTFEYDSAGRLSKTTTGDVANPGAFAQPVTTLQYSYDANSSRTGATGATAVGFSYTYDGLNRVIGVNNGQFGGGSYTYDALSRLTRLSNSAISTFTYDDASQLLNLSTTLLGNPLDAFTYTYDPLGNRTSLTDRRGLHGYTYDDLSRLTAATHPLASLLPTESYTYDPVGNRRTSYLSLAHTYDVANRLLEDDTFTYTYDANGNLTNKTTKALPIQTTTYTYDIENQLTRIDLPTGPVATYRYDGLGRRIEKNITGTIQRFVYDQEDLVSVYDATGCWQATFTHGPGIDQPLAFVRDDSGDCTPIDGVGFREQVRPLQTDGLGSITSLVSETSGFFRGLNLQERYTYDSFGTPRITGSGPDQIMDTADDVTLPASALGNPYLFTGREWDPESELYYYRARYYDPRLGRFLQEDPFRGVLGQPDTHHLYTYARNNPLKFIDPSGKQTAVGLITAAIVGTVVFVVTVVLIIEGTKEERQAQIRIRRHQAQCPLGDLEKQLELDEQFDENRRTWIESGEPQMITGGAQLSGAATPEGQATLIGTEVGTAVGTAVTSSNPKN